MGLVEVKHIPQQESHTESSNYTYDANDVVDTKIDNKKRDEQFDEI